MQSYGCNVLPPVGHKYKHLVAGFPVSRAKPVSIREKRMAAYPRLDTEVVSMVPTELPTDLIVKKKRGKTSKRSWPVA